MCLDLFRKYDHCSSPRLSPHLPHLFDKHQNLSDKEQSLLSPRLRRLSIKTISPKEKKASNINVSPIYTLYPREWRPRVSNFPDFTILLGLILFFFFFQEKEEYFNIFFDIISKLYNHSFLKVSCSVESGVISLSYF